MSSDALKNAGSRLVSGNTLDGVWNYFPKFNLIPNGSAMVPFSHDRFLPSFNDALYRWGAQRWHSEKPVRVLLVQPPNPREINPSGNTSVWAPLGIWQLASAIRHNVEDAHVRILDGTIKNLEQLIRVIWSFRPDLLGVSVLTPTVEAARILSNYAKDRGSLVVWGNDHPTMNHLQTLDSASFVDVIIRGDSCEKPLSALVQLMSDYNKSIEHFDFSRVERLDSASWRVNDGIRSNPIADDPLDAIPALDFHLMPKETFNIYANNFNRPEMYGRSKWHPERAVGMTLNIAQGCHHGSARCVYCDIPRLELKALSPKKVWNQIRALVEHYGVNLVYPVCDNFTSFAISEYQLMKKLKTPPEMLAAIKNQMGNQSWVDLLIEERPPDLAHVKWFVYARADDFAQHPEIASKLKKLGVIRVNCGIDHADDFILNNVLNKGNVKNPIEENFANRETVRLLKKYGIQGYFSLVVGGPCEKKQTLQKVLDFVRWAIDEMNELLVCWDPSILLPLKGGPIWKVLVNFGSKESQDYFGKIRMTPDRKLIEKFAEAYGEASNFDQIDTRRIAEDAMKIYAPDIRYEDAEAVVNEIYQFCNDHGIVAGGFGIRGLTPNRENRSVCLTG